MSKRNKLMIFVVILLAFVSMMIFYNYKDASKLPTVMVKYNNESVILKPSTYDYENKTSIFSINRKQSKDNTLNLKPSSSVNIIFNEEPHEYNLSIEEDK
ncbi:hypothetical protein, partial [Clostridium sp. CCUG 7971]|uniref:hypothetical protein n=1 Tax=Clostridium sp. CCUG 7971 TaxID=2811414 RepID=UPI001ABAE910